MDEIVAVRDSLSRALEDFSVSGDRVYQPAPSVVRRPTGIKTLFRPFTSPTHVGVKIIVDPPAPSSGDAAYFRSLARASNGKPSTLHGLLALCDKHGLPVGIVNAEEITDYRTSLCALIPYAWRKTTANIVVFGAGKQALWHIRLVLALRGDEIKHITIVNRSLGRGQSLLAQVKSENDSHWKSPTEMNCLATTHPEYQKQLQAILMDADVVFCTTASVQPLFPGHYLGTQNADKSGCYVSSIGSWQPDMIESDPEMLKNVAGSSSGYNPGGYAGGAVLVDDREQALTGPGEIIQSHIKAEQLVEVGEILSLQESASTPEDMKRWLQEGFLIYKSVEVSVTDLAAGLAVLSLARKLGQGISVPDF